jgi:ATP-dependent Clp protease ATP-binding subunit ClpA
MKNNHEIEQIVDAAVKLAKQNRHEYVLTEHVLLALVRHAPFRNTLVNFGTNVDMLDAELEAYLHSLTSLVVETPNHQPRKTNALERCFNRAMTQVLFTG